MQGLLSDLPLLGMLELISGTRQTGVLEVQAEVPYAVVFVAGQVVNGGILDWLGLEALQACPLVPETGAFTFAQRQVMGQPLAPFNHVMSEWARVSDEWATVCAVIGSPSRLLRGPVPLFERGGGRSVRAAAREAELPVFEVAQFAAQAVREGRLELQDRYEWMRLRLAPTRRATAAPARQPQEGRSLGELVAAGMTVPDARARLLNELRMGLRFPGSGWVLRDLVWEVQHRRRADAGT